MDESQPDKVDNISQAMAPDTQPYGEGDEVGEEEGFHELKVWRSEVWSPKINRAARVTTMPRNIA